MTAWEDDFAEPNEDELTARRVLSLALVLINARRPLTTDEIRSEVYADMPLAQFRKTFQRDREKLTLSGMTLANGPKVDKKSTWVIDDAASFVEGEGLTQDDALTLDLLLAPLASDPSYPFAADLRLALAKIDRSFDGSSFVEIPPEARRRDRNLSKVEHALGARHAIKVRYTRADGTELERTLAPYGLFYLRGETYLVAAQVGHAGAPADDPHTYRLSRMEAVTENARSSYEVPLDFDVRDFVLLPFQMGPARYDARFVAPADADLALEPKLAAQGTWENGPSGKAFLTWVSDEDDAASWAIAEGLTPASPPSLVEAWKQQLVAASEGWS